MNIKNCVNSRLSKNLIGLILLGFSLIAGISGFTVLPVIGFIFAVPFFVAAIYFFRLQVDQECQFSP
ncbi:MAG: hypothetical protein SWH61_14620 [Thermodesulfobacteriota bacterium]|nr:hypothetical protein [Thermodesulfobacteriota bacterium]